MTINSDRFKHPKMVEKTQARRALIAGSVGNFIEWYEFVIYGFFTPVIALRFFGLSVGDNLEGLVKAYATFAIAFFFRPVGAFFFGRLGDRIGRRPTLVAVILLMSCSTALIGFLPTYDKVGFTASVLITLTRIVQGLSAGGEIGGAVSIMTESAPEGRRGLYGAWQSMTVALGMLAGASVAALTVTMVDAKALYDWGWRVPFITTIPLGLLALWLRLSLDETPSFKQVGSVAVKVSGNRHKPRRTRNVVTIILFGIARIMGWSAAGFILLIILPSYRQAVLHASLHDSLVSTVIANAGFVLTILPAGAASDRCGRRVVMILGLAIVVVLALPLMMILQSGDTSVAQKAIAVFVAGAAVGLIAGPGPSMLAEMFSTDVRYTGVGVTYSLSNALFSGAAGPIIIAAIQGTGNTDIPAYYLIITGLISIISIATLRGDTHRGPLPDH